MKLWTARSAAVGWPFFLLLSALLARAEAFRNLFSRNPFSRFKLHKIMNFKFSPIPPIPPSHHGPVGQSGRGMPIKFSLFPFFGKNASRTLLADIDDYFRYDDFASTSKKTLSLGDVWANKTHNSKGLLIFLMPAVLNQLTLLSSMSSFLVDRLAQYLQPTMVLLACTLMQPAGVSFVRGLLFGSIALGAIFMVKDTILTGSLWTPLPRPVEDSYAIVTG
jgi:hypothetical protein